jgi:quinol monooxygenase YgiN
LSAIRPWLALAAVLNVTQTAGAQTIADTPVHVVAHVDILPDGLAQAKQALSNYVAQARKDAGLADVRVLEQIDRPNHFTLLETFRSKAAYETHLAMPHVLAFRTVVQPYLGSPFDERLHSEIMSSRPVPDAR